MYKFLFIIEKLFYLFKYFYKKINIFIKKFSFKKILLYIFEIIKFLTICPHINIKKFIIIKYNNQT